MRLYTIIRHVNAIEKGLETKEVFSNDFYIEHWGHERIQRIKELIVQARRKNEPWEERLDALYESVKGAWGYIPPKNFVRCDQCGNYYARLVELDIDVECGWPLARICKECLQEALDLIED